MSWHPRERTARRARRNRRRGPRERFGAARSVIVGVWASRAARTGRARAFAAPARAPSRLSRRSRARFQRKTLCKARTCVLSRHPTRAVVRGGRAPPRAPPRAWPPLPFLRSLVSATIRRGTTVVARADAYAGRDGAFPADADTVFASGPPSSVLSLASESGICFAPANHRRFFPRGLGIFGV